MRLSNMAHSLPGIGPRKQLGRPALASLLASLLAAALLSACAQSGAPRHSAPPPSDRQAKQGKPVDAGKTTGDGASGGKTDGKVDAQVARKTGSGGPVKVGLLLPLTGRGSRVGPALLDAASMALFDLGDKQLVLLPRDTKGTPEGAAAAARSVLSAGAELIIGPLLSGSVQAVTPLAQARQVPLIAFSTNREAAASGTYLLSFTPHQEVNRIVAYARDQGIANFAALLPESDYGRAVAAGLEEALKLHGGELIQIEYYPPSGAGADVAVKRIAHVGQRKSALNHRRRELRRLGTPAARRELRRLKKAETWGELGFEAIVLADGVLQLTQIAPFLQYYDVDLTKIRLLGTGLWNDDTIIREPALQGGWFAAPAPDRFAQFSLRYEKLHSKKPPRIATLGYDAAAIAAVLAQRNEVPRFSGEQFHLAGAFDGKDGIFRFKPDGNADRGLAVLEVTREGFKVIDAPPTEFDDKLY